MEQILHLQQLLVLKRLQLNQMKMDLVDLEDLRRVVGEDTAALNADKSEYTWFI